MRTFSSFAQHTTCAYSHDIRNFSTTNAAGAPVTSTVIVTSLVTPTVDPSHNTATTHSSSNVGPIVGGVIGGIVGLGALVLLFWFFKRRSSRDDFDGNFDPDSVRVTSAGGGQGDLDLAGDHMPTPYSYTPGGSGAPMAGGYGGPQMAQHGGSVLAAGAAGAGAGALAAGAAAGGSRAPSRGTRTATTAPSAYSQSDHGGQGPFADYAAYSGYAASSSHGHGDSSAYPTSSTPTSPGRTSFSSGAPFIAGGSAHPPTNDYRGPSPGPSVAMTGTTPDHMSTSGSSGPGGGMIPSSKEREAARLRVVNQPVVQHQDGGRLDVTPEDEDGPSEIPPSYDSIPKEEKTQ